MKAIRGPGKGRGRGKATEEEPAPIPQAEEPPEDDEYEYEEVENEDYAGEDWKYGGTFNYHEPSESLRAGKLRGRKAASDLFALVSSRNHRDIVRKNEFMSPAAFDVWNSKQKSKCWAGMEDYDRDGQPTEFVVRRGNQNGPIIAVNGYTTKPSDWESKRKFYESHPMRADRSAKKGVSYRKFLDELYGYEEDAEGFATEKYLKRRKDLMDKSPYNLRMKNPSPYNIFQTRLISPAWKNVLAIFAEGSEDTAKEIRKKCNEKHGKGWMMKVASQFWDVWVKEPILQNLEDAGHLDDYIATFQGKKRASVKTPNFRYNPDDESHVEEFERWLFARAEIKEALIEFVRPLFNRDNKAYKQAMSYLQRYFDERIVEAIERQSPASSPYKLQKSKIPRKKL